MKPGKLDLDAPRWAPFAETWLLTDVDLTDATFAMQVRQKPDATGDPLVDLDTVASAASEGVRLVYGGTDTVANHVTAGRIEESEVPSGLAGGDDLTLSLVGVRINETTMEGLPFPQERGGDLKLAWDLHVTPSGGLKDVWLAGDFNVLAGATQ